MEDKVWYYQRNENKEGPFTDEDFIKLINMKIIDEDTDIWMLKMKDWVKLKDTIYSFYLN